MVWRGTIDWNIQKYSASVSKHGMHIFQSTMWLGGVLKDLTAYYAVEEVTWSLREHYVVSVELDFSTHSYFGQ
jgi:hypothetical protein